jgi:hypothetical protein
MTLPELEWQIIYGRIAWIVVFAALAVKAWSRSRPISHRTIGFLLIGAVSLNVLPNEASLAYWLGLAFLWPSGLLVGLCLIKLHLAWKGEAKQRVLPARLAIIIVLAGTVLYLDAIGLLSLGIYYLGFGPVGAPLLALSLAVACSVAAIFFRQARSLALAVLLATMMFTLLRLPTGSLWDALLDPMLYGWAVISLFNRYRRRRQHRGDEHSDQGNLHLVRQRISDDAGNCA